MTTAGEQRAKEAYALDERVAGAHESIPFHVLSQASFCDVHKRHPQASEGVHSQAGMQQQERHKVSVVALANTLGAGAASE